VKNETIIETLTIEGTVFELIEKAETIYAGKLGYATNLVDETDIGKLFDEYIKLPPMQKCTEPDWYIAISIDYCRNDVPKGFMFAKEVETDTQEEGIDIYKIPASLFIRVLNDRNSAKILGKDECGTWELFGIIKEQAMSKFDCKLAETGAPELECDYKHEMHYAYVPVIRTK
jgi:hypothetical protein